MTQNITKMTEWNDMNLVTLAIVYYTVSKWIWYVSNGMAIAINIIHVLHSSANAYKHNEINWLQYDIATYCEYTFNYKLFINYMCVYFMPLFESYRW